MDIYTRWHIRIFPATFRDDHFRCAKEVCVKKTLPFLCISTLFGVDFCRRSDCRSGKLALSGSAHTNMISSIYNLTFYGIFIVECESTGY